MKRNLTRICAMVVAALFMMVAFADFNAHARLGGGRSFGSRGSRSYSQPSRTYTQPAPNRNQPASPSSPSPYQPQQRGGFLRSLAGGIMGGVLGGMLFRSLGFAGVGGAGGGIGLFEIILIVGVLYLIYRFVKGRRRDTPSYRDSSYLGGLESDRGTQFAGYGAPVEPETDDVEAGLAHIRQMDPYFDENRFNDGVMDIFFKVQGAWMNRDLSSASGLLTDEMRRIIQEDVDTLIREKKINRLENIAVRDVDVVEAWQESGQDYITAVIRANLLDYSTDDTSGAVISGSKTDPVKFEEYWTFTRPVGNNSWKLSAIGQA
jgi:predicted lipid-binding transport protein (Tim44 family)